MWANEFFGEISCRVGLDKNENTADSTKQELNITETGTDQTRDTNTIPTVDYHNEIWYHVNQSPRHTYNILFRKNKTKLCRLTNHIHIVVVELDILGNDGLDNSINNCNQHNEEHNKMHITGSYIFLLKTDSISIVLFTFSFLLKIFKNKTRALKGVASRSAHSNMLTRRAHYAYADKNLIIYLFSSFESKFSFSLKNFGTNNTSDTIEIGKP